MEAKKQLYEMKLDKMYEDDQIYITGWKNAIDFIRFDLMNKCDIDIIDLKNVSLRQACFSIMNRFFNFIIDSLEEKMDEKMDEMIAYAEEQDEMEEDEDDFDLIPPDEDDYDIPDPEWMECENDCASCSSDTCNHRTEEYQVVDDIYDPDAYLYREVIKK